LTQAQIPTAGGNDPLVRPCRLPAQQFGGGLVVNQDSQSFDLRLLVGELGISKPRARRFPVGVGQDFIAHFAEPAGNQHD
jgi:hypothetical protein